MVPALTLSSRHVLLTDVQEIQTAEGDVVQRSRSIAWSPVASFDVGVGVCPGFASVTVFFMDTECAEPYIFVPKAFTPNGDDNNDKFIVRGANIKEMHFIVWDRWGEKVYETSDILALGWDGTYNGKESTPDSYAWYLEVTCGNGATYVYKGNVTLLK